jgi:hypothetical protein
MNESESNESRNEKKLIHFELHENYELDQSRGEM